MPNSSHLSPQSIRETFTTLRKNGKARHRDIAEQLGISEGELIAAHVGAAHDPQIILQATRLATQWPEIVAAVESLGEVMALTRNASCVHEKTGIYSNVSCHGDMGLVLGGDIDLRIFYQRWAHGFAVVEHTAKDVQRSLQFFDVTGTAVHKIFLKEKSEVAAFDPLVRSFADDADKQDHGGFTPPSASPHERASGRQKQDHGGFTPPLASPHERASGRQKQDHDGFTPPSASPHERANGAIDVIEFRHAWATLQDTHEFCSLLKKFALTRLEALCLADPVYVRQAAVADAHRLLQAAAQAGVSLMVFVGSGGTLQIHCGPIHKVALMGPWVNVMDRGFNLHLRQDHIASAWVVKKPTAFGLVTSFELFDAQGDTIAMFCGKRKSNAREMNAWHTLIENLQQEPAHASFNNTSEVASR